MGSPIHWVALEKNLLGARYEINQIGRASGIENWLPQVPPEPAILRLDRHRAAGVARCRPMAVCLR